MSVDAVETPAPAVESTPAVEAPPEAPKATEPPKPRPGEFARKAAAERERVQRANADKASAEDAKAARAEAAELKARLADIEKRRSSYTQNPLQALQDAFPGMDPVKAYELIAESARNHGKAPVQAETYALQQRLDAMEAQRKADLEAQTKASQQSAREQAQAAEAAFRSEVADFVKENAETFELTALYEQTDAVYATIDAHYEKTMRDTGKGEILPTKKAAELVEAKLEELVAKAMKAKKIAAKLPKEPDPTPKTLSNDLSQQTTFVTGPAKSEQERMARAMAALEKLGV
jgi:hypothetical protein